MIPHEVLPGTSGRDECEYSLVVYGDVRTCARPKRDHVLVGTDLHIIETMTSGELEVIPVCSACLRQLLETGTTPDGRRLTLVAEVDSVIVLAALHHRIA